MIRFFRDIRSKILTPLCHVHLRVFERFDYFDSLCHAQLPGVHDTTESPYIKKENNFFYQNHHFHTVLTKF